MCVWAAQGESNDGEAALRHGGWWRVRAAQGESKDEQAVLRHGGR